MNNNEPAGSATFLGHPRGLATLFFTEFFERFSYYGMRALLVLFLTAAAAKGGLGVDEKSAGAIYGLYAGSVYLFSLPGGWIADRLIGARQSIWYGGILISLGNFVLGVPGGPGLFYLGLLVIALGTGLLKPNVSAVVGDLYVGAPGARRDSAFAIFYLGINLGATLAPLGPGTIGETVGYRWGFVAAGAAMLIGLAQFRLTEHYLGGAGFAPTGIAPEQRRRSLRWLGIGVATLVAGVAAFALGLVRVTVVQLADWVLWFMMALAIVFFAVVFLFGRLDGTDRRRVAVIFVFCLCAALFFGGFEQAGTTLNLFARDLTDRSLLGGFFAAHEHPASWYQSVNPMWIILLSPFFAWFWLELGRRQLDPSAPVKFGIGLALLGLGFGSLIFAANLILAHGGKVGPQWLLWTYFLHTSGELCLSPIGLSNVTKLAPRGFASQMMGTWFLGTAIGNNLAGRVGGGIGTDVASMPAAFLHMTLVGVGAGAAMFIVSPLLRRWMGGIR
jgi:POT family proton-dependent oligopeptide transporter